MDPLVCLPASAQKPFNEPAWPASCHPTEWIDSQLQSQSPASSFYKCTSSSWTAEPHYVAKRWRLQLRHYNSSPSLKLVAFEEELQSSSAAWATTTGFLLVVFSCTQETCAALNWLWATFKFGHCNLVQSCSVRERRTWHQAVLMASKWLDSMLTNKNRLDSSLDCADQEETFTPNTVGLRKWTTRRQSLAAEQKTAPGESRPRGSHGAVTQYPRPLQGSLAFKPGI